MEILKKRFTWIFHRGLRMTIQGQRCVTSRSLYIVLNNRRELGLTDFSQAIVRYGFRQSQGDHTLFIKHSSQGKVRALIVYIDDIVLTGDDLEKMARLKTYLAKEFEIKDLGKLKYFLRIDVARSKEGIFIPQHKYVLDLLKEIGMIGSKAMDTPMNPNLKLGDDPNGEPVDKGRYQRLEGKLIYLAHARPDIVFAVSVVCQFIHDPKRIHIDVVFRILKYLKSALGKGLCFAKHGNTSVEAYTDAY